MSELSQILQDGPLWVVMLGLFFAIEVPAIFNKKKGDTLSEVIRFAFGFSKRSQVQGTAMKWRRGSFYAFCAWFLAHIAFGL